MGAIADSLLLSKQHRLIERVLVGLVALMSVVFVTVMVIADTDWFAMLGGLNPLHTDFSKSTLILAIIGTTIVPYNLYLQSGMQAAATQHRLNDNDTCESDITRQSDWPLFLSIGVGGVITLAIMSCA